MAEVAHSPAARSPWEKPHPVGAFPEGEDHYFRDVDPKRKPQERDAPECMTNGAKASPSVTKSDYRSAIPEESLDGDHYTANDFNVPEEELSPEDAVDSKEDKAASAADNLDIKAPKGDQKTDAGAPPSKVGAKDDEHSKPEQKQGGDEEPGKSGTKVDDKAKSDEATGQPDLQEVEPEPIGEDVEQAQEKPADTAIKVGEEREKPGDGEASMAGSTVKEGMSKIGSAVGSAVGAGGGDASKQGEEKAKDVSAKQGDEKVGEAEAQVGDTAEEGKDKPVGVVEDSKDKLDESPEGDKDKLEETAEAKTGEVAENAEAAKPEGSAEKADEAAEGAAPEDAADRVDYSILKGGKVNKGGNVVNSDGKVVGRIKEGVLGHLVGKRVDENGAIWNDSGSIMGRAEPIPADELESMTKESGPFEAFPDAVVDGKGMVVFEGEQIGKVVEGDVKKLRGMKVDPDGDILDRAGNIVGKAERWEPEPEPEPEPEAEVDRSILAGKRVNKAGNVVDGSGTIFGRVVEGDVKRMVGRMCDKKGNVLSESGDVLGRAEVNGNVLGSAERWEEPEVEKRSNPMAGRRVNREGNVVDEDGNLVGKLTTGELSVCAGKEIDDDGDVVDSKGNTVGHVSLLADIPPEPVEEESAEDKAKRELDEKDKDLAKRMSVALTQVLDKIKPICEMITRKIEKADRTPKEELDEEELVKEVRPLIEEGGKILQEANGVIRGLDPDGRIQANAKHKAATREATPEEYHLADILKELTGTVTKCIDDAKRRLEGMPHAKKELNPLWGLLSEPLFQILAAVGLLLNGVLGLVGRLLSGLGLGGLVDSLLGGLGVKQILESLGIGSLTDALTGKNQKKKSGGLLGLGG
ncbi:late embryogenesis abundant protein [Magnaporthiopsis poae ATCC 64411]|uniref:Late embryogenesis abundant protein n=1 Tax=Magnaporthiopsis poae (strain ATCC 64411 / 73-15) TaxID=644358 RepID=A0A0C4DW78_MAGP6|nr:late embryogenesis abundant protein [Magnaporthiopsis poae ATCC 64411]